MLMTNQHLDKLAAMQADFVAHGMLPAGHMPPPNVSFLPRPIDNPPARDNDSDGDNDNEGPVDSDMNVLGHVVLARFCGKYCNTATHFI
jgi:hypothetical protein